MLMADRPKLDRVRGGKWEETAEGERDTGNLRICVCVCEGTVP